MGDRPGVASSTSARAVRAEWGNDTSPGEGVTNPRPQRQVRGPTNAAGVAPAVSVLSQALHGAPCALAFPIVVPPARFGRLRFHRPHVQPWPASFRVGRSAWLPAEQMQGRPPRLVGEFTLLPGLLRAALRPLERHRHHLTGLPTPHAPTRDRGWFGMIRLPPPSRFSTRPRCYLGVTCGRVVGFARRVAKRYDRGGSTPTQRVRMRPGRTCSPLLISVRDLSPHVRSIDPPGIP